MSTNQRSPEAEKRIGILCHATTSPGIGGRLRDSPEDFLVEELLDQVEAPAGKGTATVFKVRTRSWDTLRLASRIARDLHVSRHRIRYAGTKDKRAVCVRHYSVDVPIDRVRDLRIRDCEVLEAWTGPALTLGGLNGNRFEITVTAPDVATDEALSRARSIVDELIALGGFPNFFGPQRFGGMRATTHLVGMELARGDLRKAVEVYISHEEGAEKEAEPEIETASISGDDPIEASTPSEVGEADARSSPPAPSSQSEARRAYARGEDPAKVIELLPPHADYERTLLQSLIEAPGDYASALRRLPKGLLWMFIHALQSHVFNLAISRRMLAGIPLAEPQAGDLLLVRSKRGFEEKLVHAEPTNIEKVRGIARTGRLLVSGALPGPGCTMADGPQGEFERQVLADLGLDPSMFTVPGLPEASSKGGRRPLVCPLRTIDVAGTERGVLLKFDLPPGSYATALLREVMKPTDDGYHHSV